MNYSWYPLWTDLFLYFLLLVGGLFIYKIRKKFLFKKSLEKIIINKIAVLTGIILLIYISICMLDSIHLKVHDNKKKSYNNSIVSILDIILYPMGVDFEKSYTKPFAKYTTQFNINYKVSELSFNKNKLQIILLISGKFFAKSLMLILAIVFIYGTYLVVSSQANLKNLYRKLFYEQEYNISRYILLLLFLFTTVIFLLYEMSLVFHVCGTDKVGHDIFYQCIKSIRTSVLIGFFTLAIMLPVAIILGIVAGYVGGRVDDLIQYVYTTISSIPGVLLIAASILSLQVFISNHSDAFRYLLERADLRLLSLCLILGCTGWTSLCRIIRAETLKIRELEFIDSAISLGVSKSRIIFRHILPNVQHIVLITIVLDFSGLILAEAVLSYVGVGVSPTTMSWGNMINSARLELAREPIVWWPIFSAFSFMFILVLSANLFADQVRDIIDPRHTVNG